MTPQLTGGARAVSSIRGNSAQTSSGRKTNSLALLQDRDARIRFAFARIASDLNPKPSPKWYSVTRGHGMTTPWAPIDELVTAAIDGALETGDYEKIEAVRERIAHFADEIAAVWDSRFPNNETLCVKRTTLNETVAESGANPAQAELLANPTKATVERALEEMRRHHSALGLNIKAAERWLNTGGK